MRYGVLGTGVVGQTLGSALIGLGHEVCMGSRSASNEGAAAWASSHGDSAHVGTFADAAAFGEVVLNGTAGIHSLAALEAAGPTAVASKVLIDVANPLDFSGGFPPRLSVAGNDSLAEQIQRRLPDVRVVKALNTVTASVMVDPGSLAEPTDLFIAGDDAAAKGVVTELLVELGWSRDRVRDLGGLAAARATEMYLMLWVSLMGAMGTAAFNVRVVPAEGTE
jgi:8-hydroxy-5-deazaflavin:NADPH oxidoreductase